MNNAEDIFSQYERYRQVLNETNQANKSAVLNALAAASITTVTVDFDGCGDSGQINSVSAFSGENPVCLPHAIVTRKVISWGSTEAFSTQTALEEAIEGLCYGYLEETHDGWENNDGAYGGFQFNVASGTIELEFNGRFTDHWTDNRRF